MLRPDKRQYQAKACVLQINQWSWYISQFLIQISRSCVKKLYDDDYIKFQSEYC